MSAATAVAGYPVHAVDTYTRRTNPHGVRFTDWRAACGAHGTDSGHGPFGLAGSARRQELCTTCFPGRHWNGAHHPDPVEVEPDDPLWNLAAFMAAREWAMQHGHLQPDDRMLVAYGEVIIAEMKR